MVRSSLDEYDCVAVMYGERQLFPKGTDSRNTWPWSRLARGYGVRRREIVPLKLLTPSSLRVSGQDCRIGRCTGWQIREGALYPNLLEQCLLKACVHFHVHIQLHVCFDLTLCTISISFQIVLPSLISNTSEDYSAHFPLFSILVKHMVRVHICRCQTTCKSNIKHRELEFSPTTYTP